MTLAQARQLLHQHISPNGPDDVSIPSRVNEVCERFFVSGRWKGMIVEVDLDASQGYVTLPRRCEAVLGITVKGVPRTPFGRWHTFVPGGPGRIDNSDYCGPDLILDEGDSHPVFRDSPYEVFRLRAKVPNTSDRDTGNYMVFKGNDADGNYVFDAEGNEGVSLPLTGAENTTTQYFSSLHGVLKPLTQGYVTLWAVDAQGNETQIGEYEPGETNVGYRRYRVAVASGDETVPAVRALCKRRYVPVLSEHDEIIPDNMGALKLGLISLKYEDTNDLERATEYFTRALSLLNAELREQRGSQFNPIRFSPHGFGLGRINRQY
jgi:hypothetical protein